MLWWYLRKLKSADPKSRDAAIKWFSNSEHKFPAATRKLIEVLKTANDDAREAAADALRWAADQTAVEPLIGALADPVYGVRVWSADALGRLGGPRAFEALEQKLRAGDDNYFAMGSLIDSIAKFGEPAAPALMLTAGDARPDIRERVASAAGYSESRASFFDILKRLADDADDNVRRAARKGRTWRIDPDAPLCFKCGNKLAGGKSLVPGARDLELFDGTICHACQCIFCVNCAARPLEQCPDCRGTAVPAYRRELKELSGRVHF